MRRTHPVIGLISCCLFELTVVYSTLCLRQGKDKELTPKQTFDSACSVSSYNIHVTEEVMHRSAEALSRTGIPQRSDTQETVRKMAAMKTESVPSLSFPVCSVLMTLILFVCLYKSCVLCARLTRHRVRLNTLKLLLERGADPNVSRVPMPVLFLAIMAADAEAVRRLLLCGAHTDIPLPPEAGNYYYFTHRGNLFVYRRQSSGVRTKMRAFILHPSLPLMTFYPSFP